MKDLRERQAPAPAAKLLFWRFGFKNQEPTAWSHLKNIIEAGYLFVLHPCLDLSLGLKNMVKNVVR